MTFIWILGSFLREQKPHEGMSFADLQTWWFIDYLKKINRQWKSFFVLLDFVKKFLNNHFWRKDILDVICHAEVIS